MHIGYHAAWQAKPTARKLCACESAGAGGSPIRKQKNLPSGLGEALLGGESSAVGH